MSEAAGNFIPEGTMCSECGENYAQAEVNGEPLCSLCAEQYEASANEAALDRIAEVLASPLGAVERLIGIARILRETGRGA